MRLLTVLRSVAPILAVLLAWKAMDRVDAPRLSGRKVIYLGPGCGHVAYTMGFVGGLLEDAPIREAILSRRAVFGGASSGAFAAAFAMATLHGDARHCEGQRSAERRVWGGRGGYAVPPSPFGIIIDSPCTASLTRIYNQQFSQSVQSGSQIFIFSDAPV